MNPGVEFAAKNPIKRNGIETTQVKSIICLTDLDDGAANDGSGKIIPKSGIVYEKTYSFKVESYTNGEPGNKNIVKWEVSYTNSETGLYHSDVLDPATGDTVNIIFRNSELCGNDVKVKAYINDMDNEGILTIFHHNRFRFFDKSIFINSLNARKSSAKLINQSATSLCGTAAILYLFAKQNSEVFFNVFKNFFRTGKGQLNGFKLEPNSEIFEMKPEKSNEDYPHFVNKKTGEVSSVMNIADWVTLVGTRSTDNKSYTGKDGEDWDAINWPSYMVSAAKGLFNTSNIIDDTSIITGFNYEENLRNIENDFKNGWNIILLIDSDMLEDSVSIFGSVTNYHWITYNGDLIIGEKKKFYSFSYYCWGAENKSAMFRSKVFNTNYYGYVKFK